MAESQRDVLAVIGLVNALEPLDPSARDGWMVADAWCANTSPWALRFTSSRTFHLNEGLTGFAYQRPDCATPELTMRVNTPSRNFVTFEEPIVRPGADGPLEGDTMAAECTWASAADDVLKVDASWMCSPDGRRWRPRDPNAGDEVDLDAEKAIRVIGATRPVYLDDQLLVLRSAALPAVCFIWSRVGEPDPTPRGELKRTVEEVAAATPAEAQQAILAAALAARDARGGSKGSGRPSMGGIAGAASACPCMHAHAHVDRHAAGGGADSSSLVLGPRLSPADCNTCALQERMPTWRERVRLRAASGSREESAGRHRCQCQWQFQSGRLTNLNGLCASSQAETCQFAHAAGTRDHVIRVRLSDF